MNFKQFYSYSLKMIRKDSNLKQYISINKPSKFTYKSCFYDLYYKIYILKKTNIKNYAQLAGITIHKIIKLHLMSYLHKQ